MRSSHTNPTARWEWPTPAAATLLAVVFAAYLGTAKFGLNLSVAHGVVTPVWAPTGIALVALVLGGRNLWPAIALAAFAANTLSGVSVAVAAVIAVGNTAEALAGLWILRRTQFRPQLDRTRDVVALVLASLTSTLVSATVGSTTLLVSHHIHAAAYGSSWTLWWFGDVMGDIIVAALLLSLLTSRIRRDAQMLRVTEGAVLAAAFVAVNVAVFSGARWHYPGLLFPLFVWAATRFRQRGAAVATFVSAVIGIYFTVHGSIAVSGLSHTRSVQVLQLVLAFVGVSELILAATLTERDAMRDSLDTANAELREREQQHLEALRRERQAAEELRTVNTIKDGILVAVSHELRTPLTSVVGFAQTLRDRRDTLPPALQDEMLEHLIDQSVRLERMLSDLLDLDQLRRGLLEPRRTATDVGEVVHELIRARWANGAQVVVAAGPAPARVDVGKVERIVDNLVMNALKYSGSADVRVRVDSHDDGVLIVVDDDGPGVPDDLKPTVFDPFVRGSAASTPVPGTGVGLSIVAQFAELHGGRAWVQDSDTGGASFHVYLPGG